MFSVVLDFWRNSTLLDIKKADMYIAIASFFNTVCFLGHTSY